MGACPRRGSRRYSRAADCQRQQTRLRRVAPPPTTLVFGGQPAGGPQTFHPPLGSMTGSPSPAARQRDVTLRNVAKDDESRRLASPSAARPVGGTATAQGQSAGSFGPILFTQRGLRSVTVTPLIAGSSNSLPSARYLRPVFRNRHRIQAASLPSPIAWLRLASTFLFLPASYLLNLASSAGLIRGAHLPAAEGALRRFVAARAARGLSACHEVPEHPC